MHDIHVCKDSQPDPTSDRAYFPLDSDLKNMAKCALQLSCLDQENAMLKKKRMILKALTFFVHSLHTYENPTQPEVQKNGEGNGETENAGNYKQQLVWVHQTDWQKQLLARYGNTITREMLRTRL